MERPRQVAGPGRASFCLSGSGCPARPSRRGPGRVDGPGVSRPPPDAGIWAPGRGMRGEAQARTCPLPGPREPELELELGKETRTGRGPDPFLGGTPAP